MHLHVNVCKCFDKQLLCDVGQPPMMADIDYEYKSFDLNLIRPSHMLGEESN